MLLKIEVRLCAALREDKKRGIWESWCPALDVFAQGDSFEEAQAGIQKVIVQYIRHCYARKILDDVLNDRGFAILPGDDDHGRVGAKSEMIRVTELGYSFTFDVDVPLYLSSTGGIVPRAGGQMACYPE